MSFFSPQTTPKENPEEKSEQPFLPAASMQQQRSVVSRQNLAVEELLSSCTAVLLSSFDDHRQFKASEGCPHIAHPMSTYLLQIICQSPFITVAFPAVNYTGFTLRVYYSLRSWCEGRTRKLMRHHTCIKMSTFSHSLAVHLDFEVEKQHENQGENGQNGLQELNESILCFMVGSTATTVFMSGVSVTCAKNYY